MFRKFPQIDYSFSEKRTATKIVDIFRAIRANDLTKDDVSLYQFYDISDGDRPDTVSDRLYGDTQYHWTFFMVNDTLREGLEAWPKAQNELEKYLELQYDSVAVLEFRTVISTGTVQSFDVGTVQNFTGALAGYPFKQHGYVKGFDSSGQLRSEGIFLGFDVNLNQVRIKITSGLFSVSERLEFEPSSPTDLTDWAQRTRPLEYDLIFFSNSSPVLVDNNDGSPAYYTYTPDITAIENAVMRLPFFARTVYLSSRNAPRYYVNASGDVVQNDFLQGLNVLQNAYIPVSNYEYETEQNDARKRIRVIAKEAITAFSDEFERLIKK